MIIVPDTISYYEAAKALYLYGEIDSTRPILFSLISGLPFLFGNISIQIYYWWNVLINIVLYFFSLKMVYKLTNKTGVILFISLIGVIGHIFLAVTEIMVMTMLLYGYYQYKHGKGLKAIILMIFLLGFIKPVFWTGYFGMYDIGKHTVSEYLLKEDSFIIITYFKNLFSNMIGRSWIIYNYIGKPLAYLTMFQNLMMCIIAFILLWKKQYFVIIPIYLILIHGLSHSQGDRFHIMFYPLVLVIMLNYLEKKHQLKFNNIYELFKKRFSNG